jgi:hypothetical protein
MVRKSSTVTVARSPVMPFIDEMPKWRYAWSSVYPHTALSRLCSPSTARLISELSGHDETVRSRRP